MKRTFTINISGTVFHIDEDAYINLQDYLERVESTFSSIEEGSEVIADIEARIVELLHERLGSVRQVVTIVDVEYIINILGRPEDFEQSSDSQAHSSNKNDSASWKTGRRMYRDYDDAVLGGVASGMAAYFGIDPVVMRVLFIISFFFAGPLLYIVLWIAIPAARTSSQKLEMRGENVNIENIEKQIRNEYENVKGNLKKKDLGGKIEKFIHELSSILLILGKPIGRILLFAFMLFLLICIIAIIIKFTRSYWMGEYYNLSISNFFKNLPLPAFLTLFFDSKNTNLFITGILIVCFIPILGIFYAIIRTLLGIKKNVFVKRIFAFVFLIGLSFICYVLIVESTHYKGNSKVVDSKILSMPEKKKLCVILTKNPLADCIEDYEMNEDEGCGYYYDLNNYKIVNKDFSIEVESGKVKLSIVPEINIKRLDTDSIKVKFKKTSLGDNKDNASENANAISYSWKYRNDTLFFEPFFTIQNAKWRMQKIKIDIFIPKNLEVELNDNANGVVEFL
ncbi:MAG: PspC domain-containing protein [Bacteroidales bacterium]|nr:PspC domain-containing protein [Bacteroidales bacterium]